MEIIVDLNDERIDKYLSLKTDYTRSQIQKLIKEKNRWFISLKWIKAPISEEMIQILSQAKNVYLNPDVVWQIHKYMHPERYE